LRIKTKNFLLDGGKLLWRGRAVGEGRGVWGRVKSEGRGTLSGKRSGII
jgi:hypothetical protein